MLIFTHDKVRLGEHFRRDPVLFAYHLGDLDDFLFPRCQWAASYHKSTRIDECILIYHAPYGSTVLAFGLSERFAPLLEEALDLFPTQFYGHFFAGYRSLFARMYEEGRIGTGVRMRLAGFQRRHSDGDERSIRRLGEGDLEGLTAFYDEAFPQSYFEERMVATGKYFGWIADDRLAGAAGVHVYSPEYKIAVIGNVATHPDYRGRGIATRLTSRLAGELAEEGLTVCLNVMVANVPALRCYEKLGFERVFAYEEGRFVIR